MAQYRNWEQMAADIEMENLRIRIEELKEDLERERDIKDRVIVCLEDIQEEISELFKEIKR